MYTLSINFVFINNNLSPDHFYGKAMEKGHECKMGKLVGTIIFILNIMEIYALCPVFLILFFFSTSLFFFNFASILPDIMGFWKEYKFAL